ncbi:MAG TPA: hypothetical protein VIK50_01650 [Gemmatimonadaceae bacterium]
MADEKPTQDPGDPRPEQPPAAPVEPRRSFLRRHWGKMTISMLILIPVATFSVWAAIALAFDFSTGERVGWVQKLSRRGWLCKTWEGELQMSNIPGSAPILFQFSVPADSIAGVIESAAGRKVALYYEQHIGVPTTCFGETQYFVSKVRILEP